MSDARRALYEQLQMTCAGHRLDDVIGALCDSLASSIGYATSEICEADLMVAALPDDLKRTIRENWAYLRSLPRPESAGRS